MSFHSGNGGYVLIGTSTTPVNIGKWTLRKNSRLVENTHSGVSASNYEAVVPDHSANIELPWDSDSLPDTDLGLAEGAKLTITFKYGASTKTAKLEGASIESLEEVVDNAGDIVRAVVSTRGGVLTRPVT